MIKTSRHLLGRIKKILFGPSIPVHDLTKLDVILQPGLSRTLHFSKETRVEIVRQSISLLFDTEPEFVQLLQGDSTLEDDCLIADLSIAIEGNVEVSAIIAKFNSVEGFLWKKHSFNAFPDRSASDLAREQSVWFHQQNKLDSVARIAQLQGLIRGMGVKPVALVIMTFSSNFLSMFMNWVRSCDIHNIAVRERVIIFPMDDESRSLAERLGFKVCYDKDSRVLSNIGSSRIYGDPEFTKHMFFQNAIIRDMLSLGCNFIFQDVDLVWLEDPFEYFDGDESYDIEFMFDGKTPRHGPLCANTGFMYFRPSCATISFWEIIYQNYDRVIQFSSQQQPLNRYLGLLNDRGLKINILPEALFANGHLFNPDQEKSCLPEKPKVIHCSWTGNVEEKVMKYKNNKLWYLGNDLGSAIHTM